MRREEIMLRGHHIWLKCKQNIVHNQQVDLGPLGLSEEEFYEVAWLVNKETAIMLSTEAYHRRWRRDECKPLHAVCER